MSQWPYLSSEVVWHLHGTYTHFHRFENLTEMTLSLIQCECPAGSCSLGCIVRGKWRGGGEGKYVCAVMMLPEHF